MKKYTILLVAGLLGLYACSAPKEKKIENAFISSSKGIELYGNPDYIFLDVRTEAEHNDKAIPNTQVIPVQTLESRIGELEPYRDKKIVVYCRSGNRSSAGTKILLKHGYNAINLLGGMNQWQGPVSSGE